MGDGVRAPEAPHVLVGALPESFPAPKTSPYAHRAPREHDDVAGGGEVEKIIERFCVVEK
jgi:hypothetical protein